ncbi:MarR family winged helix-turn-helix transcriptional regulator [Phytohabitans sp. LJ34]|uniref:MarR family winged helix-turn-helix transcriptional regulator n=1 Tax=Phytohabitans sp. LJ34 TaxID=3452217 RepID=UPI003F8913AA
MTPTDSVDRIVAAWSARDPGLDASPLEVVGRLLLCAQHCEREILAALAAFDLSFADFDVINTLRRRADPGGTNPTDLARSSLITSGAMTARLNRLEAAGLVERTPDAADRRAVRVRLTTRGERLAERALGAVLAADERFLDPLDRRQRDALAGTLRHLLRPYENL